MYVHSPCYRSFIFPGIYVQERRVPRSDCVHPRAQTRVLPERAGKGDVCVRPLRVLRLPALARVGIDLGRRISLHAARCAGRRGSAGSPESDGVLD